MRHGLFIAIVAMLAVCRTGAAVAQEDIPCEAFQHNADGSWTATDAAFVPSANFSVRKGGIFRRGDTYKGYDLAAKLDDACGSAVPPPPAVPPAAGVTPQPPAALSTFADANGNIDLARLNCGHLADARPDDAALLIAWYAGTLGRNAKGHTINLARLRYAVRGVIDHCKANRGESLIKIIDATLH